MKFREAIEQGYDGLEIIIPVSCWNQLRDFVERLVKAKIVRCNSPERESLCNNPAIQIFWNDEAEWYCCCYDHSIVGPQFTGNTHWCGSQFRILVDPVMFFYWYQTQADLKGKKWRLKWYKRDSS